MSTDAETTIYVALLEEGVEVFRPVKAIYVKPGLYKIAPHEVPAGEIWEFQPGQTVLVNEQIRDGKVLLIAQKP